MESRISQSDLTDEDSDQHSSFDSAHSGEKMDSTESDGPEVHYDSARGLYHVVVDRYNPDFIRDKLEQELNKFQAPYEISGLALLRDWLLVKAEVDPRLGAN